jgi:hypothetical protein
VVFNGAAKWQAPSDDDFAEWFVHTRARAHNAYTMYSNALYHLLELYHSHSAMRVCSICAVAGLVWACWFAIIITISSFRVCPPESRCLTHYQLLVCWRTAITEENLIRTCSKPQINAKE